MTELTQEYIKSLLDYDPETGLFTWKARPREMFKTERAFSTFNARHCGGKAGNMSATGYWYICIDYKKRRAHRLAWLYVYGYMPKEIDHINGDRLDNRICNLRSVDRSENNRNMGISRRNTSGTTGVYSTRGLWGAYVTSGGKTKSLGRFGSKSEAIKARKYAEQKMGFHENHGSRPSHSMAQLN